MKPYESQCFVSFPVAAAKGTHETLLYTVVRGTLLPQRHGTLPTTVYNSVSWNAFVTAAKGFNETLLYTAVRGTLLLRCHGTSRTTVNVSVLWGSFAAVVWKFTEQRK